MESSAKRKLGQINNAKEIKKIFLGSLFISILGISYKL
jgi:hypothetical protein